MTTPWTYTQMSCGISGLQLGKVVTLMGLRKLYSTALNRRKVCPVYCEVNRGRTCNPPESHCMCSVGLLVCWAASSRIRISSTGACQILLCGRCPFGRCALRPSVFCCQKVISTSTFSKPLGITRWMHRILEYLLWATVDLPGRYPLAERYVSDMGVLSDTMNRLAFIDHASLPARALMVFPSGLIQGSRPVEHGSHLAMPWNCQPQQQARNGKCTEFP